MNKFLTTIFSDDIREEISGKTTYVGVYGSTMYVRSFPMHIPRLFLTAKMVVPINESLAPSKIVIYQNNEVIAEHSLPPIPEVKNIIDEDGEPLIGHSGSFVFCFEPLVLSSEGKIKVELHEEGRPVYKAEGLSIRLAPDDLMSET